MRRNKKRMYAIGAFDRFNYGDLLFPVITKRFLEDRHIDISLEARALISSDYSRYGALRTKPIRNLYMPGALNDNDIIYFAGGGTIGSDYLDMLSHLTGHIENKCIYYFKQLVGLQMVNYCSRKYFGGRSPFPWAVSPHDFTVPVKVLYNSIGGSEFSKLNPVHQRTMLKILSEATYLSVRDAKTKKLLAPIEAKIPVNLAPDSATLMSTQYTRDVLAGKISTNLKKMIPHSNYVCFQSNKYYARKNVKDIVKQLENVYHAYGYRTLLLPVGRYVNLDDYSGLLEIMNKMNTPVDIVNNETSIWDIMYTIASSQLFLGTSLHGNITAQSFAIPHIGLSEMQSKVDYYLETWDIPEYSRCVSIDKIHRVIERILAVPKSILQNKSEELIALTKVNIEKIMHAAMDN